MEGEGRRRKRVASKLQVVMRNTHSAFASPSLLLVLTSTSTRAASKVSMGGVKGKSHGKGAQTAVPADAKGFAFEMLPPELQLLIAEQLDYKTLKRLQ